MGYKAKTLSLKDKLGTAFTFVFPATLSWAGGWQEFCLLPCRSICPSPWVLSSPPRADQLPFPAPRPWFPGNGSRPLPVSLQFSESRSRDSQVNPLWHLSQEGAGMRLQHIPVAPACSVRACFMVCFCTPTFATKKPRINYSQSRDETFTKIRSHLGEKRSPGAKVRSGYVFIIHPHTGVP